MKGIIFNLLEEFIVEQAGEEKYEEILEESALETKYPFVGPGRNHVVIVATQCAL